LWLLVFMQQAFPQNMEFDGIEGAAGITLDSLLPVKSGERSFQQFINHNTCE
jgi:hypothetical protein